MSDREDDYENREKEQITQNDREPSKSRSRSRSRGSYNNTKFRSASRSPRRSRSRSRSPYVSKRRGGGRRRYSRSYSRSPKRRYSRSRSRSPYARRRRSRSTSPMSDRRRHIGNRENPPESSCLGIFGLSLYTTERDLRDVYGRYGSIEKVHVVYDHQTGRSRGFAFLTFESHDDAQEAKVRTNGMEVDGRRIRVDFSITKRAHTPTPGIYMGKPTRPRERDYGYGGYSGGGRRRSASPYGGRGSPRYNRNRYSRSRSRSFSPRRY